MEAKRNSQTRELKGFSIVVTANYEFIYEAKRNSQTRELKALMTVQPSVLPYIGGKKKLPDKGIERLML